MSKTPTFDILDKMIWTHRDKAKTIVRHIDRCVSSNTPITKLNKLRRDISFHLGAVTALTEFSEALTEFSEAVPKLNEVDEKNKVSFMGSVLKRINDLLNPEY